MINKNEILDLLDKIDEEHPEYCIKTQCKTLIVDVLLDYLKRYNIEEKPEITLDCWVDPETGVARSGWEIIKLTQIAKSLGYILVPRFCSSKERLNYILKDVRYYIKAKETLARQLEERGPVEVLATFDVPEYEKEQGFSEEFETALKAFIVEGDEYEIIWSDPTRPRVRNFACYASRWEERNDICVCLMDPDDRDWDVSLSFCKDIAKINKTGGHYHET